MFFQLALLTMLWLGLAPGCSHSHHKYCQEVCAYNQDHELFDRCHARCAERMREQ